MASKKEFTGEEPEKTLTVFQSAAEENKEFSKMESEENNTDSSGQNSPRGVLEIPISSVHSDVGSSGESSSSDRSINSDGTLTESHGSQWRNLIGGLLSRKKKSMIKFSSFPPANKALNLERKSLGILHSSEEPSNLGLIQLEIPMRRPSWRHFDFQELAVATDNFSNESMIGKGGHAEVYKGRLPDGQLVAVKRLTKRVKEEERISDFLSELGIIAHVNHPNAAQLIGFCVEGGLHMVLQFSQHGSLSSVLHGSKERLKWRDRFDIALGVAEGLFYLHGECQRRIIHRDIKASNILLNEDYQPQISDFGLAKWLPENWTHHVVFPIEGTFGYMAPEYFMHGVVNEKTDVFAFGVLLLELITGRGAVDSSRKSLVIWAKPFLDVGDFKGLMDPSFKDESDNDELRLLILIASMCIHDIATSRPTMNMVVQLLRGEIGTLEFIGRASKPRQIIADACEFEDYTRSRYLSDLHRHKQLALEQ
ncbi:Receptor-like cytosolic serine/threonine-protein kinase RBK1 [Platanthera guangdongensis]|uniref:Receptor-like cytosolic serine/threonine-protein kinase RBK1 n=1 Tax=Platanthera guangdongensis TaxID=2320717 RepID=A0ABR2MQ75_9ASPA